MWDTAGLRFSHLGLVVTDMVLRVDFRIDSPGDLLDFAHPLRAGDRRDIATGA